jgi:antitoxin (DNA-binding transcriptional repressor) of toxin-antitoxin stability system
LLAAAVRDIIPPMTMVSAAKARSNLSALLKKASAGESIGIRYGKKVLQLVPTDDAEDTSYAEKEYGMTKAEVKRAFKKLHEEGERDRKAGKSKVYTGDIEALIRD